MKVPKETRAWLGQSGQPGHILALSRPEWVADRQAQCLEVSQMVWYLGWELTQARDIIWLT